MPQPTLPPISKPTTIMVVVVAIPTKLIIEDGGVLMVEAVASPIPTTAGALCQVVTIPPSSASFVKDLAIQFTNATTGLI